MYSLLRLYCPEVYEDLPRTDTIQTFRGTVLGAQNPDPIAMLEVGRLRGATQTENGELPILCVWDKGGYHGEAPDLVPYTYRGKTTKGEDAQAKSERDMIAANGFDATGLFAEFRERSSTWPNPSLNDPYVVALFQFIMMTLNMRRWFYYGERHKDSPRLHLQYLIGALGIVTYRTRMTCSGVPQSMPGAALPPQQPLLAQVMMQPYQNPWQQAYQESYPPLPQQPHQQPFQQPFRPLCTVQPLPPHHPSYSLPQSGMQSQQPLPAFDPGSIEASLDTLSLSAAAEPSSQDSNIDPQLYNTW